MAVAAGKRWIVGILALESASLVGCSADETHGSGAAAASGSTTTLSGSATGTGTSSPTSTSSTASGGEGGSIEAPPSIFSVESVDLGRNRLLDTLAQRRGAPDRCALWSSSMTDVEKGIFLTHTDMLGHRSCMNNADVSVDQMQNGCSSDDCVCSTDAPCHCLPGSEQALDHVFKYWAVNGSDLGCCTGNDCCNGGGEWHRTFFSADDQLIAFYRDVHAGLPEWDESHDFGGPHDPFTQSDETQEGSPRGQTHFWSQDSEASTLQRNGVEGVDDPHIVEIDNDYNILHDSNPEGTYSFQYGRSEYKDHWNSGSETNRGDGLPTTFKGNGAPGDELGNDEVWLPSCGPIIAPDGVAPKSGGGPDDLLVGKRIVITGVGFTGTGDIVHLRTRSIAVTLDASSPLFIAASSTSIEVQVPIDLGTGEGFVSIESGGVLTNVVPVTFSP